MATVMIAAVSGAAVASSAIIATSKLARYLKGANIREVEGLQAADPKLAQELEDSLEKLSEMPKKITVVANQQSEQEAYLVAFRYRLINQALKIEDMKANDSFNGYPTMLNELADTTKKYYEAQVNIDTFLTKIMYVITHVLMTQKLLLEDYQRVVEENIELRKKIVGWGQGIDFTQASVQKMAKKCLDSEDSDIPKSDVFKMILTIDKILGSVHALANKKDSYAESDPKRILCS